MKISQMLYERFLGTVSSGSHRHDIIVDCFEQINELSDGVYGLYRLVDDVHSELTNIAHKFDPKFEPMYYVGEEASVYVNFKDRIMKTELAGSPEYTEDYDEDDPHRGIDVLGVWTINLMTGEVKFHVQEN